MLYSPWYLVPEKGFQHGSIKRYITDGGKRRWQRLPISQYRDLGKADVEALLRRLNATHVSRKIAAESRYDLDHAYINVLSLTKFEEYISSKANSRNHIYSAIHLLTTYAIEFFVIKEKLPDPYEWFRKETEWGQWLLRKDLSAATIRRIVSTTNRFTRFLSTRLYPEMKNPRVLEPLGKNKLKKLEPTIDKTKGYITNDRFVEIIDDLEQNDPGLIPHATLCYKLGLRIAESQGLTKEKFYKTHVLVDEQGDKVIGVLDSKRVTRRKVKTLDVRKVPYWYISGKEAWGLVKKMEPMHPDTLTRRLNERLTQYGLTSHDFRRTFITNAMRDYHWRDVQKAVGHKDVRTTMGYARDDRGLDDEKLDLD